MNAEYDQFEVGDLVSVSDPYYLNNKQFVVADVPYITVGIILRKQRIESFYTVYANNEHYHNVHASWITKLT